MSRRAATPKPVARAVVTPPRRKTCGSAASAKLTARRHGKRPAPKPAKSFPIPKLHNPRERLVALRMGRLREQLRMDAPTFARLCGVTPAALASHEAQARPWPADTIIKALPRIGEACAAFAAQLEDSSALMAEIEQDTRW